MTVHYYSHHIGDYQKDTAGLSLIEHGVYRLLMDEYYANERPLPKSREKLMRICRAVSASEKRAVDAVIAEHFEECDEGFRSKRCDAEIARYQQVAGISRSNGKKGGRPRKHNPEETQNKPSGLLAGSEIVVKNNPEQKPTINHEPLTKIQENTEPPLNPPTGGTSPQENGPLAVRVRKPKPPTERTAEFEQWYAIYPRKVAPEKAAKAFKKSMPLLASRLGSRDAALQWLIGVTAEFAMSPKSRGDYCWHPATFLSEGHYDDDKQQWQRGDGAGKTIVSGPGQIHPDDDKGF